MWKVDFHWEFLREFDEFPLSVQKELAAMIKILEIYGPMLGRPKVDTLKGSRFAKMKELRFDANGGVWRVAFAFDPKRNAILLVGGDKTGVSQARFYDTLLRLADERFSQHLAKLAATKGSGIEDKR